MRNESRHADRAEQRRGLVRFATADLDQALNVLSSFVEALHSA